MSIYTRAGDSGTTSLASGERVSKSSLRVEAYGAVDVAQSAVGLAAVAIDDPDLSELLAFVLQRLFNCSSALAGGAPRGGGVEAIDESDVAALERAVDRFESETGPLRHFVVGSGCEGAARLHMARAMVRTAERRVVALSEMEPVPPLVESFLNRLSDALFAAARYTDHAAGAEEAPWDPDHPTPSGGAA